MNKINTRYTAVGGIFLAMSLQPVLAAEFCQADCVPLPTITINDVTVGEAAGTATFTVTLSAANTATVNYASENATATAGSDYTAVSGVLNFDSGLSQIITVPVLDDTVFESAESFNLNLSGATGATIADPQGVGTITDNDIPPGISFDVSFPRSNLASATIDQNTNLITAFARQQFTENNNDSRYLFTYFKLNGVLGKTPTIKLGYWYNGVKYNGKPWSAGRKMMYSYNNEDWFFINACGVDINGVFLLCTHNAPFTENSVYIAWGVPYTVERMTDYINSISASPFVSMPPSSAGKGFVISSSQPQIAENGLSIPAQPYYSLRITDSTQSPDDGLGKRTVILFGGVHAGEDIGSWALQGAMDFLLGSDPKAVAARKNFDILVYPMINPAGRYGGHWRGAFESVNPNFDPNRHFHENGKLQMIDVFKNATKLDTGVSTCVAKAGIDFHGDIWNSYGTFSTGTVEFNDWLAKVQTYQPSTTTIGTSAVGAASEYLRTSCGAAYGFTVETGNPSNFSQPSILDWGATQIKVLVDLFNEGRF